MREKRNRGRYYERKKGILTIRIAAPGFSGMSVCVHPAGDLPSMQKAFFRYFVALLVTGFLLLKDRTKPIPKKAVRRVFSFARFSERSGSFAIFTPSITSFWRTRIGQINSRPSLPCCFRRSSYRICFDLWCGNRDVFLQ